MTKEDFEIIVEQRIALIRSVLTSKGEEYGTSHDRLHNFKVAARMGNTTPAKALKGMRLKHEVSIDDLIYDQLEVTLKNIDEKIGDSINYLILLEALLKEELHDKTMGRC